MSYDDQKELLRRGGLRCSQLIDILGKLGFQVRDCSQGGHKVYKHTGIPDFHGSDFNCGHRSTADVKPVYIRKILRIVEQYEDEIRAFLGEKK